MNPKKKRHFTAEEIKKALSPNGEPIDAVAEMIATINAVFTLVRMIDMDPGAKNVLARYEKQFLIYKNLLMGEENKEEEERNREDGITGSINLN